MPIDTSIYDQIKQPDPLATYGQFLDIQNKQNTNKLAQMEIQGKQALGQAIQEATGPDGQVDSNKLGNILKDPKNYAAAAAGAALGLDLTGKQLANTNLQMGQNEQNNINLSNAWGARLSAAPNKTTAADLRNDVVDMMVQGRITSAYGKSILADMPDDDKGARQFAITHFVSALGPAGQAAETEAPPIGPDFTPRKRTQGQFAATALGADDEAGAAGGAPPNPAAPAGVSPAPVGAGVPAGAPPVELEAAKAAGANATNQATSLANVAMEVNNRKAMLHNMLDDVGEFTSGPWSDDLARFNAGVNELFGTNFNLEKVAANERFNKIANQIALAQASAGGFNVTDLTKNMTSASNPHSGLSSTGVKSIIGMLLGNEDAIAVKWNEFEKTGLPYSKFTQWSNQFNKNFDPRVFQSVYMSPNELRVMLGTMKGGDRDLFRRRYNYAVQQQWIPDPRDNGAANAQ